MQRKKLAMRFLKIFNIESAKTLFSQNLPKVKSKEKKENARKIKKLVNSVLKRVKTDIKNGEDRSIIFTDSISLSIREDILEEIRNLGFAVSASTTRWVISGWTERE
jgi:hypothetical protein